MKKLKLLNGMEIDPSTRSVVPTNVAEEEDQGETSDLPFSPAPKEMKLEDLPTNPQQMNVICAVLGYSLMGLPAHDIEIALGCSSEQLAAIMGCEAYDRSRKHILESFIRGQTSTAREILSTGAIDAARTVVHIAKKSKSEVNRLKAAENILKSTGVAGEDSNSVMSQGLVIKIIRDQAPVDINIKVG